MSQRSPLPHADPTGPLPSPSPSDDPNVPLPATTPSADPNVPPHSPSPNADPTGPLPSPSPNAGPNVPRPSPFPTGPYAGRSLDEIALIDPDYLLDLVREGAGDAALRAEAAMALAARDRLPPARIARALVLAALRRIGPPGPSPRPWAVALGIGLAAVLGLALLDRVSGVAGSLDGAPARRITAVGASSPADAPAVSDSTVSAMPGDPARRSLSSTAVDSSFPPASNPAERSGPAEYAAADPASADPAAVEHTSADPASPGRPRSATSDSPAGAIDRTARDGASPPCGARVPGAVPAESVEDFVDTYQAVEFEVVGTKDTGRVTFLNSHVPYEPGHFYVAIFPDDYSAFPEPPALFFRGACVVVRGTIERYRGTPQVVLRDPDDVRIVTEP